MDREKIESDGYKELKRINPEFVRKFESDTFLKVDLKNQFLEYMQGYTDKSGSVTEFAKCFMREHKQMGEDYIGSAELFIRMNDLMRFRARINEIIKRDASRKLNEFLKPDTPLNIRKTLFKAMLDEPIKEEIRHEPDHSIYYLGMPGLPAGTKPVLGEAQTGSYIEWSYPNSEEDVFEANTKKLLDCRAGLSENESLDKVLYSHLIKACRKVCKPTVFDAEDYPQFEPGGKTKPLKACENDDGLEEYVHTPNRYKYIEQIDLIKKT